MQLDMSHRQQVPDCDLPTISQSSGMLQVLANGNVYGALPQSFWRSFSICLMLIHQVSRVSCPCTAESTPATQPDLPDSMPWQSLHCLLTSC